MTGRLIVDGIKCGGRMMLAGSKVVSNKSGFATSTTTIKPFSFGALRLTDDDRFLGEPAAANIGEISLEIWRAEIDDMNGKHGKPPEAEKKVHEREKKATTHRVKLGDEVKVAHRPVVTPRMLDHYPLVTFIFKYRPLDVLRANGIVTSSVGQKRRAVADAEQNNVKEEENDGGSTDTTAKIKALEEELDSLRKFRESLAGSKSKSNPAKRMKLEPLVSKGFVSGEVIDLT